MHSSQNNSMFREGIDEKEINEKEVIPFYDRNEEVEACIYKFLQSTPPEEKAKIMTLFEPTGTGKTTIEYCYCKYCHHWNQKFHYQQ